MAVWQEFIQLALKYGSVSIDVGSPISDPPQFVIDAMTQAMKEGMNQYYRTMGHPELIKAIAKVYGPTLGRELNPLTEIMVSSGANGCLHGFIMGLVNPGDEVVMFDPHFPTFIDHVRMA